MAVPLAIKRGPQVRSKIGVDKLKAGVDENIKTWNDVLKDKQLTSQEKTMLEKMKAEYMGYKKQLEQFQALKSEYEANQKKLTDLTEELQANLNEWPTASKRPEVAILKDIADLEAKQKELEGKIGEIEQQPARGQQATDKSQQPGGANETNQSSKQNAENPHTKIETQADVPNLVKQLDEMKSKLKEIRAHLGELDDWYDQIEKSNMLKNDKDVLQQQIEHAHQRRRTKEQELLANIKALEEDQTNQSSKQQSESPTPQVELSPHTPKGFDDYMKILDTEISFLTKQLDAQKLKIDHFINRLPDVEKRQTKGLWDKMKSIFDRLRTGETTVKELDDAINEANNKANKSSERLKQAWEAIKNFGITIKEFLVSKVSLKKTLKDAEAVNEKTDSSRLKQLSDKLKAMRKGASDAMKKQIDHIKLYIDLFYVQRLLKVASKISPNKYLEAKKKELEEKIGEIEK
ncbi:MAG: hypothetical protein NZL83_00590 [Candidatus Absconditabacterales bacterium]|nr:hypothetical protein [Candidatus Absconditabacterales bacterium]